ncbi:MAG: glycosyltransferase family A protein [Methylococcales bacterium]|nr:glycosyltransferase family A protein [Methylococcales bacterium]
MTTKIPAISIIVPVFNLEDYVSHALDSILAQENCPNFEVLVIDDHSTDNTLAIITAYSERDSRIKILTNQRKKGVAGARNTGFDNARGEWIAFLDGDDVWESYNLASLTEALNQYPDVNIIISDFYEIGRLGRKEIFSEYDPVWNKYFNIANKSGELLRIDNPVKIFLEDEVLIRTGACLIRYELVKQVGYCDEELEAGVDLSWFLKLSVQVNYIVYVPKPLMTYVYRPGSLSRRLPFDFFGVIAFKKLLHLSEFKPYKKYIKSQIAKWTLNKSMFYRKNNNKLKAIQFSVETLFFDFTKFEYWRNFLASIMLR